MDEIFLDIVNLSLTASWVVGVVLLLRLLLRPVPKKYVCLLWMVVLFRLLCPVTLEAEFSLVPQHQSIQPEIVYTTPQVQTAAESINHIADETINPILAQTSAPNPQGSVNPLQIYLFLAARLWLLGIAVLCGYTLISRLRLRQQLREALPAGDGVYLCDTIASPFVFGILNPKIYLPFDLAEEEQQWVLLHERSHIARRDFLLKPLFWLAVLLHWMNPLVWLAWHFYSRDVELACDEQAICQLDDKQKRCYSDTLLQLAVQTAKWSCPVAFGNNSVKQRIQHVLRYKQAALGVTAVAVIVIVMMMAALGVNPMQVYPLGDLQPELEEKVDTAYLQWGSVQLEITEQEDIDRLQQTLADLQVQEKAAKPDGSVSTDVTMYTSIAFAKAADPDWICVAAFKGDCTETVLSTREGTRYFQVKNPQQILPLFAQYGTTAREQLQDTTFSADLNHDGVAEQIVVNPKQELINVYTERGIALPVKSWVSDNARESYHLCELDGKSYLLRYCMQDADYAHALSSLAWELYEFGTHDNLTLTQTDEVSFSLAQAAYHFDTQAIYAFLQSLNEILENSTLLLYTDGYQTKWYSTTAEPLRYSAEEYLDWLKETADGELNEGTLLERLQRMQNSIYFDLPQKQLTQWLKENRSFDAAQQELTAPALQEFDGVRGVSFELHWRDDTPMQGRLINIYAIAAQRANDLQSYRYYLYNQADDTWELLTTDAQQKELMQLADQWAQSWADRDGKTRYALMSNALQHRVDQSSDWENTDYWEDWMPMWVTNEEGKKGMFLRGSSPWANSWQTTVQMPEMDSHGQLSKPYLVILTYDMIDSGQNHYAYEETLQCQQNKNTWQVIDCTVTVDYLTPEFYEAAQTIYQNVLHGHDTWRLDPELVAMTFVREYLALKDGSFTEWNVSANTICYHKENGDVLEIQLYQPMRHLQEPSADFWAVECYWYTEWDEGNQPMVNHYDLKYDLWASLHVAP